MMINVYHHLVILNAVLSAAVAVVVFIRNRYQLMGPIFAVGMLLVAAWLFCFAHYFQALPPEQALWWAKCTLMLAFLDHAFFLHSFCLLVNKARQFRWWIAASYLTGVVFTVLLWQGHLLAGLKPSPYMDHYVRYNRIWSPFLGLHMMVWEWLAIWLLIKTAWTATGYKRTQLIYFIVVWSILFLNTLSIIIPLNYDIAIPPFGFFINPLNLAFLTYVMARTRLQDFNVVLARFLSFAVMLLLVMIVSLLFIGGASFLAPGFMNPLQTLFTVGLVVASGLSLAVTLPKFFPQAERAVQERFFAGRFSYQDVLTDLIRELSNESTVETLLNRVVTTVQSQMQVNRVLILLQDPLLDEYRLRAQSGVPADDHKNNTALAAGDPVIRWLMAHQDVLVREEQMRRLAPPAWAELARTLEQLGVTVCVPMLRNAKLSGILCLGVKVNHEMFFSSDLKLLGTLATDLALGVHYRRIEEQAIHHNKLITLGTLSAGIAHEVRNPLSSIRTFAQLLPTRLNDPDFTNEFSKIVIQDVDRITRVIQSMLSFARPGTVNIGNYSAAELVDEAIMLTKSRLRGKQIQMTKQFASPLMLCVDKQQILQVLINILNNAIDAVAEAGVIRMTTGMHQAESETNLPGRRFGVIEIADSGPGIPAAAQARLFDPFFTTKRDGTGLGLSISQKIVRDHNGYITVASVAGLGAAFQVHLPLD